MKLPEQHHTNGLGNVFWNDGGKEVWVPRSCVLGDEVYCRPREKAACKIEPGFEFPVLGWVVLGGLVLDATIVALTYEKELGEFAGRFLKDCEDGLRGFQGASQPAKKSNLAPVQRPKQATKTPPPPPAPVPKPIVTIVRPEPAVIPSPDTPFFGRASRLG